MARTDVLEVATDVLALLHDDVATEQDRRHEPLSDRRLRVDVLGDQRPEDERALRVPDQDETAAADRARREFERKLVDALVDMKEGTKMELRKVPILKLSTGMILQQEVRNRAGLLVVGKGQEVTHALLMRLENFARARLIDNEVMASVPQ